MADLAGAHDVELDRQVINGSSTSGQHAGILGVAGITSITYIDATPPPVSCGRHCATRCGRSVSVTDGVDAALHEQGIRCADHVRVLAVVVGSG